MTFPEGVFATILFDLALFGTSNIFINTIIRLFTSYQNYWKKPFLSKDHAELRVTLFCHQLHIPMKPWKWDKTIRDYKSLNDFFTRHYSNKYIPPIGTAVLVSPACCTLRRFTNMISLKSLLLKGCQFETKKIGLPYESNTDLFYFQSYIQNDILIGYLSPSDYHCVHSPFEGKVISCDLIDQHNDSSSVKFFQGKFNILNHNKRLVIVLESNGNPMTYGTERRIRVALIIVGGVGVNSIVYDKNDLFIGKSLRKGQEVAQFHAGGSAIVLMTSDSMDYLDLFHEYQPIQVLVGESLLNK